jgi:hypothetical protein
MDITTNSNEIQRIIKEYFKNLYSCRQEKLEEMDIFVNAFDHPGIFTSICSQGQGQEGVGYCF